MAGTHFCPRCPSSKLVSDPFGGALVCPLCQHTEEGTAPVPSPTPPPASADWWNAGAAVSETPAPRPVTPAPMPAMAAPEEPILVPSPVRPKGQPLALVALFGVGLLCFAIPVLVLALSQPAETEPPKVAVVTPTPTPSGFETPVLPPVEGPIERPMPMGQPMGQPMPNPIITMEPVLPMLPPVPEKPPVVVRPMEPMTVVKPDDRPTRKVVGKLQKYSEEDLRRLLDETPEIGLERVAGSTKFIVERAKALTARNLPFHGPLQNLPANRVDLLGLPMRMGKDCHLGKEEADNLHALSRKMRTAYEQSMHDNSTGRVAARGGVPADPRIDSDKLDVILGRTKDWHTADAVPTMLQMMQAENKPVRKVLIDRLADIPDRRATMALAMRAVTDLSADLREAALTALKSRPIEDYRPILLAALRYPFIPVAEHAAEALVTLNDKESVPSLVMMLDLSPSYMPMKVGTTSNFTVRELVRVNHIGNCALCHQPSFDRNDMVRGAIPIPGVAIPGPATTPAYYERDQGDFVRADITYLRQDFSVMQPVARPNNWPNFQRYDYLVRLRQPTANEMASLSKPPEKGSKNPSRDSVLFALKELTGKDLGLTKKEWESGLAVKLPEVMPSNEDMAKTAGRDWRQFVTTMLPDIKGGER